MNSIQRAQALGQSVWLDYIRRGLIKSGELKQLIEEGISGLTANPTILEKAIIGSNDYDDDFVQLARAGKQNEEIYETLAIEDIRSAADLLRPIYEASRGGDGYPSLEISPLLAYDTDGSVKEGRRLFRAISRPNVMVKVPATPEGIPAIRRLIGEGINVNVTLIFSLQVYEAVKDAYLTGLEDLVRSGGDPAKVVSVASFFLSRIDTLVDSKLDELIKKGSSELNPLLGKAAVASAKMAYVSFKNSFYGQRFSALKARNAHVQRLLWASTSTKNPAYSDLLYVEPLIGPDTVNTMPLTTIRAMLDHGKAELSIDKQLEEAERSLAALESAGISMSDVTDKLLTDGVKAFDDSFAKLMAGIEEKRSRLIAAEPAVIATGLGAYDSEVKKATADFINAGIARSIWRKDFSVWKPEPTEISNRLGWLTVPETMHGRVSELQSFAAEVRDAGFRHVVLLGMGGSSLGAEVLREVFGSAGGFPQMIVLDSTLPETVKAAAAMIDPARTLFVVSSKSGTTTEPNILYAYFRQLVERAGVAKPGENFVAITDPGTQLTKTAKADGFRHVFTNPADIGGRYSVLSYFGLVPGSLIGVDIKSVLDRAEVMREACASSAPEHDNPGLWLGACLGTMASRGRDKLTLITSPSVSSFGLWVEQLIAESTGKEGKGIVPVAGEPLLEPAYYGADRLFVYVRLKSDDNGPADQAVNALKSSGQPVVLLEMKDKLDLGAEFFRWEFATTVAGKILGINPFDQPNVQSAKDATERLLSEYSESGHLSRGAPGATLDDLLSAAKPGDYFAVMAYLRQTTETDDAFWALRERVMRQYRVATTLGYGPRFLHSTGQLHKGGPNRGLFLQITSEHAQDLAIPDKPYTFGVVADAQALGDMQALTTLGRRTATVRLKNDGTGALRALTETVK